MARLNIEDIFWIDLLQVAIAMGNHDAAIGNAIRFFRYAQEKHKNGELISDEEFKAQGFHDALFLAFAERVDGGIQCRGAGKHFNWLLDSKERGALGGKASAESRKNKFGSAQPPKQPRSNLEADRSNAEATRSPEPSSSSSSSSSSSDSISHSEILSAVPKPARARKKREVVKFQSAEELKSAIPADRMAEWFEICPDQAYIDREILKAFAYYRDNHKLPTTLAGWFRALGSWLDRGWPKHVASIPGQSARDPFAELRAKYADQETA